MADIHSVGAIERDAIALARRHAANAIIMRAVGKRNAMRKIRRRANARRVSPDVIPNYRIAKCASAIELNAVLPIARDYIARPGNRPADRIIMRVSADLHPVLAVPKRR